MTDFFSLRRMPGEPIDNHMHRAELVYRRCHTNCGFELSSSGLAHLLIQQFRISNAYLLQLLIAISISNSISISISISISTSISNLNLKLNKTQLVVGSVIGGCLESHAPSHAPGLRGRARICTAAGLSLADLQLVAFTLVENCHVRTR